MLFVFGIICCIVGVIIGMLCLLGCIFDFEDYSNLIRVLLIIGLILGLLIVIGGVIMLSACEMDEVQYSEIVSLNQGTEINGSFVLGMGTVNEQLHYYMYVKEDQGYRLVSISSGTSPIYIVEDNTVTPHVRKKKEKWGSQYTVIYVPEGTICKEFSVG